MVLYLKKIITWTNSTQKHLKIEIKNLFKDEFYEI